VNQIVNIYTTPDIAINSLEVSENYGNAQKPITSTSRVIDE